MVLLVFQALVKLFDALPPRQLVPLRDEVPGLDRAALFGDLRTDAVHLETHVDAVGHSAGVGILHHEVLIEEAEGLLRWRGR